MSSAQPSKESTEQQNGDWMRPIAKENLSERAYAQLRSALMHGQLKPGERLLLRPMSERFGISATPMREALLRLVSEKALALDARGTVVVPTLTLEQLLEIRSIRLDLEGRAAAEAARIASIEKITELDEIHAQISECHRTGAFARAVNLNTAFHLQLCETGKLPIVLEIVERLWVRCGPILSHLYDAGVPDWEPHPHLRIIAALRAHDPEAARAGIREDIEHGGKGLLNHVRSAADED